MSTAKHRLFLRYVIPFFTIVILIVLLVAALFRLSAVQKEMRYNTSSNMLWVIYNAHLESFRLIDAIQKKALNPENEADVFFRYQMLLSRLQLLNEGPQADFFAKNNLLSAVKQASLKIAQLDAQLRQQHLTRAELVQIQNTLAALSALMLEASGVAMTAQWDEMGAQVDSNRNAVLAVIFIMIGILFCSVFISAQLLLALKKTLENEKDKQHKIELKKQLENERKVAELYRSFGAMVSHQFKTPLAIIDASMQRLIRTTERLKPAEITQRAQKVRTATQRLTYLIDSILNSDQLVEKKDIQVQTFCLKQLVEKVVLDCSEVDVFKHRTLVITADAENPIPTMDFKVVGDPVLSTQIISNLINNAAKYSEQAQTIRIQLYHQNQWVACAVIDQGLGMSADELPHIFQRYFRSQAVTDVMGTGMGLYVAAELAALQQGKISVLSTLGVGSTFTLYLPRAQKTKEV